MYIVTKINITATKKTYGKTIHYNRIRINNYCKQIP